jgi:tRNA pseudouridine38-40 synthase
VTTWKLTLEYDGTRYSGWQEQKNARTVAGELRKAAEGFFGAIEDLQGAGRTDAGVHAAAQVAHLRVVPKWKSTAAEVARGLNDGLPADIAVNSVEEAAPGFHARHDARTRTYVYQISTRKTAFSKRFVWWVKEPLNVEPMRQAAAMLIGRHDFHLFRAVDPSRPESAVVVVERAELEPDEGMILFRIEASHFLWRMVRRIVGAMVQVGRGVVTPDEFGGLLGGRALAALDIAASTAPASGLFLESVAYPAVTPRRRGAD